MVKLSTDLAKSKAEFMIMSQLNSSVAHLNNCTAFPKIIGGGEFIINKPIDVGQSVQKLKQEMTVKDPASEIGVPKQTNKKIVITYFVISQRI